MARQEVHGWHRIPPALVVGGLTLGILMLFVLQFAAPYYGGLWGLVLIVILDLLIILEVRLRKTTPPRPLKKSRIVWGPVDPRYISHVKHPLELEVALTFVVITAMVGIYVLGTVFQGVSLGPDFDFNLNTVGVVMILMATWVLRGFLIQSAVLKSESEKYDTTDDH